MTLWRLPFLLSCMIRKKGTCSLGSRPFQGPYGTWPSQGIVLVMPLVGFDFSAPDSDTRALGYVRGAGAAVMASTIWLWSWQQLPEGAPLWPVALRRRFGVV